MLQQVDSSGINQNTFKEQILNQLLKVTGFQNREFRGGFYTKSIGKNGEEREIYTPDSREVFCNSCFALALLFQPQFSKKMEENFQKIIDEVADIKKEFISKSSVDEKVVLGESFYEEMKDKILLEEYKEKKLVLFLKLFARISEEFRRKNYFEMLGETY